jgi:hypothetical protein
VISLEALFSLPLVSIPPGAFFSDPSPRSDRPLVRLRPDILPEANCMRERDINHKRHKGDSSGYSRWGNLRFAFFAVEKS